eukprot:TRINITY_DN2492_c0_g1_i3.p1 TRINITY_DN2492_c0_g1~~TRINITY_DN2492_c0_g1_i3.p1  ORF type:complete len:176 (+),score=38.75 TRINITY_DN2492_c0_g1_i3:630-1157(+)
MKDERTKCNVLVTGTPGTGKTTLVKALATKTGLKAVHIGEIIVNKKLYTGRDDTYDAFLVDEDKVVDELEDVMHEGGVVADYHSCDFFPERWFDLVVVLRTNNTVLYDRLAARGYDTAKLSENIECEIMQVLLDDAKESYKQDIIVELQSDKQSDLATNIQTITEWLSEHNMLPK